MLQRRRDGTIFVKHVTLVEYVDNCPHVERHAGAHGTSRLKLGQPAADDDSPVPAAPDGHTVHERGMTQEEMAAHDKTANCATGTELYWGTHNCYIVKDEGTRITYNDGSVLTN